MLCTVLHMPHISRADFNLVCMDRNIQARPLLPQGCSPTYSWRSSARSARTAQLQQGVNYGGLQKGCCWAVNCNTAQPGKARSANPAAAP